MITIPIVFWISLPVTKCGAPDSTSFIVLFSMASLLGALVAEKILAELEPLGERDARRADIAAGAAFEAVDKADGIGTIEIIGQERGIHQHGHQLCRTGIRATTAPDAQTLLVLLRFCGGEKQDAAGALGDRGLQRWYGDTHHGTAENDLADVVADLNHARNEVSDHCPDGGVQVLGCCAGSARDGESAFNQWLAIDERFFDSLERPDVLAEDANVHRQAMRWNFTSSDGLDEHLLAAFRVLGCGDDDSHEN